MGPKFFVTVFGKIYAKSSPIDGGVYPIPPNRGDAKEVTTGDTLLIYCTKGYQDEAGHRYNKQSPGIGIVTGVEERDERLYFHYRYEQFKTPVERSSIMTCLTDKEKRNFANPGISNCWVRQIESSSFRCLMERKN
jgi:hypothetical protein